MIRSNRADDYVRDYVIVEEVTLGWERNDSERSKSQRLLDANEYVLSAQSKWKGRGRFILKQRGNVRA